MPSFFCPGADRFFPLGWQAFSLTKNLPREKGFLRFCPAAHDHGPLRTAGAKNLFDGDDEIIDRLTAVYQGDLHIGMDLGSQDALCLLRLFVGDAFAVDQGDKGGVFTGKGTSHPGTSRYGILLDIFQLAVAEAEDISRDGWYVRRIRNRGRQR